MNVQVHRVPKRWHDTRHPDMYEAVCWEPSCSWFVIQLSETAVRELARQHAQSHEEER